MVKLKFLPPDNHNYELYSLRLCVDCPSCAAHWRSQAYSPLHFQRIFIFPPSRILERDLNGICSCFYRFPREVELSELAREDQRARCQKTTSKWCVNTPRLEDEGLSYEPIVCVIYNLKGNQLFLQRRCHIVASAVMNSNT